MAIFNSYVSLPEGIYKFISVYWSLLANIIEQKKIDLLELIGNMIEQTHL